MESGGVIRNIDEVGRIVLPIDLRRSLGLEERDPVEIFAEDDKVIIKKHNPVCIFCGGSDELREYNGKTICCGCITDISNLL